MLSIPIIETFQIFYRGISIMKTKFYLSGAVFLLLSSFADAQNFDIDLNRSYGFSVAQPWSQFENMSGETPQWVQFNDILVRMPFENPQDATFSIIEVPIKVTFKVCRFHSGRLYLAPELTTNNGSYCQIPIGVDLSNIHGFSEGFDRVRIENIGVKTFDPNVPQSPEIIMRHSLAFKLNPVTLNLEQEGEPILPPLPPRWIRISLDWHQMPRELDAHLTGPMAPHSPERFHLYFGEPNFHGDVAVLDLGQDEFETKPETVTILPPPGAETLRPGIYRFIVHQFYGSGNIADSGALVRLWIGDEAEIHFFEPFYAENIELPGEMGAWVPFELEVRDDGTVRLWPVHSYEENVSPVEIRKGSRDSEQ